MELFVFSGHDTRKYDYDSDVYITNIYKNETRILDNRSVHVEFHNDEKAEKENKKENDMKEIPWHCKK
ncbi:MAG: hypothetical protein GXY14_13350 [Spirochaetes bacterium]|nr:hypothetical protein [Spirochaetota bacterium]